MVSTSSGSGYAGALPPGRGTAWASPPLGFAIHIVLSPSDQTPAGTRSLPRDNLVGNSLLRSRDLLLIL